MDTRRMVQQTIANVESLPAPIGGWNARDSFANMDPADAVTMINMFPTVSNLTMRGGYQKYTTGLSGQVQTLMAYSGGTTSTLFAITDSGNLYDVSNGGTVGAAKVTGLNGGIWNYINVTTVGGNYLYAVNIAAPDQPLLYDGTTWIRIGSTGTIKILGVTTTNLGNICLFKSRVWFIDRNTLKAWYLPTNSVGGTAQEVDLSSIARFGGHIVALDTWTLDAGYGVDDNLAFITSNGEVILYSGTDPASVSTWALIGVWKLGSPIGGRSTLKWGGDLLILTYDGLMPMAGSLQSSRLDPRVALSDKIQGAITEATTAYGGNHAAVGWQVYYTAKNNAVWINVPVADNQQEQYVMNTITKSWCRFTGWGAFCWETFLDDPYFGGDGFVGKAWTNTFSDAGSNIATQTIQAFNYFGNRGVKKYFTRARPSLYTNGTPSVSLGMNIDFDISDTTAPIAFTPTAYAGWDTATWDNSYWGANNGVSNVWLGITGIGYCGGIQFKTLSSGIEVQWASTDIVYQQGWAGV